MSVFLSDYLFVSYYMLTRFIIGQLFHYYGQFVLGCATPMCSLTFHMLPLMPRHVMSAFLFCMLRVPHVHLGLFWPMNPPMLLWSSLSLCLLCPSLGGCSFETLEFLQHVLDLGNWEWNIVLDKYYIKMYCTNKQIWQICLSQEFMYLLFYRIFCQTILKVFRNR